MRNLFFFLLPFASLIANAEYELLDRLAQEAKTDKSSLFHNYTKPYAQFFAGFRSSPIKMLEIGIYKGESVKLWEAYFPKAERHFVDIGEENIEYWSKVSQYHFADQGDASSLEHLIGEIGGDFDLIIDDGGHTMRQQIVSFETLFPQLKSGGLYVIEDLHTSYWKQYGGGGSTTYPKAGPRTAVAFLSKLIDDLNYIGARTTCANGDPSGLKLQNRYQAEIESIHFFSSLCIIIKK